MSYFAILEYLKKLAQIYLSANKKSKSELLDQACQMSGFHRKSIIRHIIARMVERADPRQKNTILQTFSSLISPFSGNPWTEYPPRRIKAALEYAT